MLPTHSLPLSEPEWERMWAPYDQSTYDLIIDRLHPQDVVIEIGAGDLRLARQMALRTSRVYAVEINSRILKIGLEALLVLPENLIPICADGRELEFPADVTTGVLLMRHCTQFRLYAEKLHAVGCQRLITNARWRMGVEVVDLNAQRLAFDQLPVGWYACWCGGTGFKEGPIENWNLDTDASVNEVFDCPKCNSQPEYFTGSNL